MIGVPENVAPVQFPGTQGVPRPQELARSLTWPFAVPATTVAANDAAVLTMPFKGARVGDYVEVASTVDPGVSVLAACSADDQVEIVLGNETAAAIPVGGTLSVKVARPRPYGR